jgi:hypothetical protein
VISYFAFAHKIIAKGQKEARLRFHTNALQSKSYRPIKYKEKKNPYENSYNYI